MTTRVLDAVSTTDGFRQRLAAISETGSWTGPEAAELVAEFSARCGRVASRAFASGDLSLLESLADDLTGRMWEHVDSHRDLYLSADSPWGVFVTEAMFRSAHIRAGQAWLTSERAGREAGRVATSTIRFDGEETLNLMSEPATSSLTGPAGAVGRTALVRRALDRLIDGLADAGMDRNRAVEAVGAATDILMAHQSRHLAHSRAYADPVLSELLPRAEIRALMNLIVGTRRGGPESSALGALIAADEAGRDLDLDAATARSWRDVDVLAGGGPDQLTLPFAS